MKVETEDLSAIEQQIVALTQKAEGLRRQRRVAIIDEIRAKIREHGISAKECGFGDKAKVLTSKYSKDGKSWSGHGRKPGWVMAHLSEGGTLDQLRAL